MDVRLVQLLSSLIGARNRYALVRLEYAMRHPGTAAPPLVDRLPDSSERTLRRDWPRVEDQLEAAIGYVRELERKRRAGSARDDGFRALQRMVRELDQYARAIRWVLTVTET